jgi:(1->4)-alpha-D-glucan 1-alpha-D-glucosylmutase
VKSFNGEVGSPESFNLLDSLLNEQFYRLSFWKVGAEEINYRRFFTVNELISVRVEELKVFTKHIRSLLNLLKMVRLPEYALITLTVFIIQLNI